jgi:hypothetical protein
MGLLAALDYHKELQSKKEGEGKEIEYRIYSWGEIYPPFLGDREHSTVARFILANFPFKLFCGSTPYDPLPQKLVLTFKPPYEVRRDTKKVHSRGVYPHEIAKEFAAFLSLVTRRRIFCGRQMRYDGLPIEEEVDVYQRSHFQEKQRLKEINPQEIYQLLENLQSMDRHIAEGFILAMRLYHSAVEMMYTEPEFSYLFLIMCLETISSVAHEDYKPGNEEEFLDSRYPGWKVISNYLQPEKGGELKELLLRNEYFTFQKLLKFVEENLPNHFWSEREDDAKPNYLSIIIGPGPDGYGRPYVSESNLAIQEWEKIEKGSLRQSLRKIYDARSNLIHRGIRLPASIVIGHFPKIPADAFSETMEASMDKSKPLLQIPPLITLERLVSYSLVEFLRRQQKNGIGGKDSQKVFV